MQSIGLKASLFACAAGFALILGACAPKPTDAGAAATPAAAAPAPHMDAAWPATEVADPAALGFSKEGLDALDARFKQSVADSDTAGFVTLLIRHGQVVQFRSYGQQTPTTPMAKDSLFRIYSMTKPITGVAMMQLYEQGKWGLDDPITKYVPELAGIKTLTWDDKGKPILDKSGKPVLATPKRPATMRELMSHTAGFGYGLRGDDPVNKAFRTENVLVSTDLDDMMAKVAKIPLLYEPGSKWYYSIAVDIQGYIVQKLSGQTFGDYLKEHVTGPMGMTDTAFYITPDRNARFAEVYHWDKATSKLVMNGQRADRPDFLDPKRLEGGGGGLTASTHDYGRFVQMLLNKGEIGGKRILKPETVELMRTNVVGNFRVATDGSQPTGSVEASGFGLDFAIYTHPEVDPDMPYPAGTYYWGGAAGTWFWIDPVNDLAFVGMIQNMGGNRPDAMKFRSESAKLVYAALVDKTK